MDDLTRELQNAPSIREKLLFLDAHPLVAAFLKKESLLRAYLLGLSPECQSALKQLLAIGQFERVLGAAPFNAESLGELLEKLLAIDSFYREIGGIAGYQEKILSLLQSESKPPSPCLYHSPPFIDISVCNPSVQEAILWGIDAIPEMGELYPLGGAADRLHLLDEETGSELPAAKLQFGGRSLLDALIRDLQAREFLYFKRRGIRVTTPIAIMTSMEKENHLHVQRILEENQWFGRPRDSFRLFTQPLVPVVNREGAWSLSGPCKPQLKPGGHGAIWKLARDGGIFSWMKKMGRKKALIRQINNPLAGIDYGLLAFMGIGWKKGMKFGFASCPRLLKAAEGVNVLVERESEGRSTLVLTNVEYCDFAKFGIEDSPLKEGEPYSRFSSNTNILFADLDAVEDAVAQCPFPGLLVNVKNEGEPKARLESTMQNIADVFIEEKKEILATEKTFITYNHRHKTISTAKRAYAEGRPAQETPENCFFDLMSAARDLLERECDFALPPKRSLLESLERGPDFVLLYHPALGPLYSTIREKIEKGTLSLGSELRLEISDLFLSRLNLDGSLSICAEQPMGRKDQEGLLRFSDEIGRCVLRDVSVRNRGVLWEKSRPFWKGKFTRSESLEIILKGRSEFIAEGVVFNGAHRYEVEDGTRMRIEQKGNGLIAERREKLAAPMSR